MNRHDALERELTAWFFETAVPRTPDFTTEIVELTATVRQRPRWTFPERWLPMTVITLGRRTAPPFPWRTVGLLALLAPLVAGLAIAIGSRERLPAPFGLAANGLVAYGRDGDIITVDPATGARHWVTAGDEVDREPRWSLDGSRLAFLREAPISVADGMPDVLMQSIVIVDRAWRVVAKSSPVAGIDDDAIAWSPDGRWIAVAGDDTDGSRGLYLVDTADGRVEQFPVDYLSLDLYWRPGSAAQLLFLGETPDGLGLVVADVDDPAAARLVVEGDGRRPNGWTPDGTRVVYTDWTADRPQLHVLDIVTGDEVVIDAGYGHVSNDGKRLLGVDASGRPCVAPIDGGDCIAIGPVGRTYEGTHAGGAYWAPNDEWIVTVQDIGMGDASLLDPDGVIDAQPSWVADGADSWQRLAP
jgi:Tol biopolymer transport system component